MEKEELKGFYGNIGFIQEVISRYTVKKRDLKKAESGAVLHGWIWVVFYEVLQELDLIVQKEIEKGTTADMCLYRMHVLGELFFAWYFRTHLAKIYDNNRPLKERQEAFKGLKESKARMFKIMDFKFNEMDKEVYKLEKFDESVIE